MAKVKSKTSSKASSKKTNPKLIPSANIGMVGHVAHGKTTLTEALTGKPVVVEKAASDKGVQYRKEKEEEGIMSILCVPIKSKNEIIGVLRLYSGVEREFTDDEIMLVTALALQGGLAIQNASMYLMLQEYMKDLKKDMWSHRSWF